MPTSDKLEPFTGHSAFGLVADSSNLALFAASSGYGLASDTSSLAISSARSGKTIDEILREAGIDSYTNDFFLGIAHWALRERAVLTFFREMTGQWSSWQNKALEESFGTIYYTQEEDRYPLGDWLDKDRRLERLRAWQCAAALGGYANDPPVPADQPPSFPNIKKRDTQGIQFLFLNWLCIECMQWNRTLADVILRQDVSKRVRAALRSPEWHAAVANQLARIDFKDYKDELLGLLLKLLVLNWPEIKAGTVSPIDLYNDVLDADKAIFEEKAARTIPKLFDQVLSDRWIDGIEAFAQREREKFKNFRESSKGVSQDKWEKFVQKEWDYTGTKADMKHPARSFASDQLTEDIPSKPMSDFLKLLY